MKILLVCLLALTYGSSALAEVRLVCRSPVSADTQLVQVFKFIGAGKDIQQTKQIDFIAYKTAIPLDPYGSAESGDGRRAEVLHHNTYRVSTVHFLPNERAYQFGFHRLGHRRHGALRIALQSDPDKWGGVLWLSGRQGMTIPIENCELLDPEIGFTAYN